MSATGFSQTNQGLVCDGVSLSAIADRVGTPVYVYSADAVRARFQDIDDAFQGYPHALHYALKANSTFAIAALLKTLGSAADANSVWEIDRARRVGFEPKDIVFTGVGKSDSERAGAVQRAVKRSNCASRGE